MKIIKTDEKLDKIEFVGLISKPNDSSLKPYYETLKKCLKKA